MAETNDGKDQECTAYDIEKIFQRFQFVEFPTSYVNLKSCLNLEVDFSLEKSAVLKTYFQGRLMKFEDAQHISAAHAAFTIDRLNEKLLRITFLPTKHCVIKACKDPAFDYIFICDLRLLKIDETICCENENHWEIARYYVSGQVEFPKISHSPTIVDFGDVKMFDEAKKYVTVINNSHFLTVRFHNLKRYGFKANPTKCIIPPNSSRRIQLIIVPSTLKIANSMVFQIMNPIQNDNKDAESNYIPYRIKVRAQVLFTRVIKPKVIESLHGINDIDYTNAFTKDELREYLKKKEIANNFLSEAKARGKKPRYVDSNPYQLEYYHEDSVIKRAKDFCEEHERPEFTLFDITNIVFSPWSLDFGKIGLGTYGQGKVTIKNKTLFKITILFCNNEFVRYTEKHLEKFKINVPGGQEKTVEILCLGPKEGTHDLAFDYIIQNKISRKYPYRIKVETPKITLSETCLKFGMVTNEYFVTSQSIRLINDFNVPVEYYWQDLDDEIPYEIIPMAGCVPQQSCRLCSIMFVGKSTKSKFHRVNLFSKSTTTEMITIELALIRKKVLVKFLDSQLVFKDIPLNLPVQESVLMENPTKEMVNFLVVDPLLPGLEIVPMTGVIRPKSVVSLEINLMFACVLEFVCDITVRINGKENIYLNVDGKVVEPKITIMPRNLVIPRIPAFLYTYIPITLHNVGTAKTEIEIINPGDGCIFEVFLDVRNEKIPFTQFTLEAGYSKVIFVKVFDDYRREYEMYLPIKVNGILGPVLKSLGPLDLQHYTKDYEEIYATNNKVKLNTPTKEITMCRLCGVITLPWVLLSVSNFIIEYQPNGENKIDFDMTNVCKQLFQVTIVIAKISPNFSLTLLSDAENKEVNETTIKFLFNPEDIVSFRLEFHPKGHGKYIAVAPLYLDKAMAINYSNLTFIGKRLVPKMKPSCSFIIFPVSHVNDPVTRQFYLTLEDKAELQSFSYAMKDNPHVKVKFIKAEISETKEITLITVVVTAISNKETCTGKIVVTFHNQNGALCAVEIYFAFSECAIILHASRKVNSSDNPYPFFPLPEQTQFYNYMDTTVRFLEKWMFFQGYRKELYPVIPDTFHAVSDNMVAATSGPGARPRSIRVSYLNFIKRIAGPFFRNIKKIRNSNADEPFKTVSEIYGTYKEIITLLKRRGVGGVWGLDPKYLLSYAQYTTYTKYVTLKNTADLQLLEKLISSRELYNRLNKQSWLDFILTTYKVFVIENCFWACQCNTITNTKRDIIPILLEWYNTAIIASQNRFRNGLPGKTVTNLTSDLKDGIAIASALLFFCPFLKEHFSPFCEIENEDVAESVIVNNACLIIDALLQIKIIFTLSSKDFLKSNFMQMLFLSIHLYITLPMFNPRETIYFNPPLLQRSCRNLTLTNQESVLSHLIILNNSQDCFSVERTSDREGNKKICVTVKYKAYFTKVSKAILLVQGYSRVRMFDTFIVFMLQGEVSTLVPYKKCKVFGSMYQQTRVDVLIPSPFPAAANFSLTITDREPTMPVDFDAQPSGFFVQRLHLVDKHVTLKTFSAAADDFDKVRMQLICLSSQIGNAWVWLRSDIGEFFIKVTTQPRWDLTHETLQIGYDWPADPCACGEECECYRTTVVRIPHKLEAKQKALRQAFARGSTNQVMEIYDRLITTTVGRILLKMLIAEAGTDMTEVEHILNKTATYTISSRTLQPRNDKVTMHQYSNQLFTLPVTLPAGNKSGKHTVTLNSESGLDIRNYKILFVKDPERTSPPNSSR